MTISELGRLVLQSHRDEPLQEAAVHFLHYWVAVKELNLRYYIGETL